MLASVAGGLFLAPPDPRCAEPASYVGPARRAAVGIDDLPSAAPDPQAPFDAALAARLDAALATLVSETKAAGITAAVGFPGGGLWSRTAGTTTDRATRFHWASVGKSVTAAIVGQLVHEGRLRFDDSLAKWFPEFPDARSIRIDQLLKHTSGAFSFQNDLVFQKKHGYRTPAELVAIAAEHGPDFCPGTNWSYSNTGYVLLAQIIEKLDGRPYHESVRARILGPLKLDRAVALAPKQRVDRMATPSIDGQPSDMFVPSLPFGAGVLVADAEALVRFWGAFLAGDLLPRQQVAAAFGDLYPMFGQPTFYGRGVMVYDVPATEGARVWLGHSGGAPGIKAAVVYDIKARVFIAAAFNSDLPAEAAAYRLLSVVLAAPSAPVPMPTEN